MILDKAAVVSSDRWRNLILEYMDNVDVSARCHFVCAKDNDMELSVMLIINGWVERQGIGICMECHTGETGDRQRN